MLYTSTSYTMKDMKVNDDVSVNSYIDIWSLINKLDNLKFYHVDGARGKITGSEGFDHSWEP